MSKVKHVLNIVGREKSGKGDSRRLRHAGRVPAVIYSKGKTGTMVSLLEKEWRALTNQDIKLVHLVEGGKEKYVALVKEVQENFLKGSIVHIDFLEVNMKEKIVATVKVHPHGNAIGESLGGVTQQVLHAVDVEALPAELPESIIVDVSALEIGKSLHIKDVVVPEGVKLVGDPNAVIFHVVVPAAEAAAVAVAPAAEAAAPAGKAAAKK